MSEVVKVYRVTSHTPYDNKPEVFYFTGPAEVEQLRQEHQYILKDAATYGMSEPNVFKVEVAPSAVFIDISALYQIEGEQ